MANSTTHERDPQRWQRWLQVAQLVVTIGLIPAVRWGYLIQERQQEHEIQLRQIRSEMDGEQRAKSGSVEELRAVRVAVDSLRTEVLQRLTRVETRLDANRENR